MTDQSFNPNDWQWQQTMLRVKDPAVSVPFYRDHFGLTLIARIRFPDHKFDLYFLASLPQGETYTLDPDSQAAVDYLWEGAYGGHKGAVLELTHNYGTENHPGQVYHPGNQLQDPERPGPGRDGFGHIAFNTEDVHQACAQLEQKGVRFKKRPNEGKMPNIAFVLDPDGYWVEIVGRKGFAPNIKNAFNLSQTMLRIKDPEKSIAFYEALGMTLVRKSPASDFCNYFLASLRPDQRTMLSAQLDKAESEEAKTQIQRAFLKPLFIPTLELTHNFGTQEQADFKHYSGNQARSDGGKDGRGFGHIGFLVESLAAAVAQLDELGYGFVKRPEDGNMRGVAFALDPDGYWVEVLERSNAPTVE